LPSSFSTENRNIDLRLGHKPKMIGAAERVLITDQKTSFSLWRK